MNVAVLPGFAVVVPGPAAVVFAAQVDMSLMSPARALDNLLYLFTIVGVASVNRLKEIVTVSLPTTFFTNSILKSSFTNKRFTSHAYSS